MTAKKRPSPSQKPLTNCDPDLAEWCAVLASPGPVTDVVPPGWQSAPQLCEKLGVSMTETRRRLRCALKDGKVEFKKFRVLNGTGAHSIGHYRRV